jgi:YD repeat-containing protein
VLDPADSTNAYRFDARAGALVFFEVEAHDGGTSGAWWRLVAPYGNSVLSNAFGAIVGPQTLPASGTYTLLVEGGSISTVTGHYTLTAWQVPTPTEALTPGRVVDGAIDVPTEQRRYTFTLADPAKLYLDALTDDNRLAWTLSGPAGTAVSNRYFVSSDGPQGAINPVLSLVGGDYVLTVASPVNATGAYRFRLLDLAEATPLTPGASVSDVLDPANSTNLYRFDAQAGDRVAFHVQDRDGAPHAIWRLAGPYGNTLFSAPFNGDVDALTLSVSGSYTLLVEGAIADTGAGHYTLAVESRGHVPPVPVAGTPLALGQIVDSALSAPGEQQNYTFALTNPAQVYFDALTNDGRFAWTLSGPAGTVVSGRPFSGSDGRQSQINPVLSLVGGDYVLTVASPVNATGAYRFRLLDLAQATTLTPGKSVSDVLDPGNSTNAYRFDARASDRIFLDVQASSGAAKAAWRLVSPYGDSQLSASFNDVGPQTLPVAGSYTLLVEGYIGDTDTGHYTFAVWPVPSPTEVITPGGTVSGAIDVPGEQPRYTFSLASPTQVYFDAMTNDGHLAWTLSGPAGTAVSNQPFTIYGDSANTVHELPAGDYTLTVSAAGDATGAYRFRLLDLAEATPLTPGVPVSDVLDPGNSTNAYRLDVPASGRYLVDILAHNASWRLIDPTGNVVFASSQTISSSPRSEREMLSLGPAGAYTLLVEGDLGSTAPVTYRFAVQRSRPFAPGDVLLAGLGVVNHYDKDMNLIAFYQPKESNITTGMAFDAQANLYVTNWDAANISKFDSAGNLVPPNPFVTGDPEHASLLNESLVFDAAGNFYVGQATNHSGPRAQVLEFSPTGAQLDLFELAAEDRGSDWVDLAADQRTLYYTSEGQRIMRYDVRTHTQLADFAHLPDGSGEAYALRILPDGGVLVADTLDIKRLDAAGNVIQTYDAPGDDQWFALNLDPDGKSFWSADIPTGNFVKFDIASGKILASQTAGREMDPGVPGDDGNSFMAFGVTVFGELTAATRGIDVVASDPSVGFENQTGVVQGTGPGGKAAFDVAFTGDGQPHSFDVFFVQAGTGNVLGSIPVTMGGAAYFYAVQAMDPDGDPLTYHLPTAPSGATIDPHTGRIDWAPTAAGMYRFVVQVEDGRGGQATQAYDLVVRQGEADQPPTITSVAPTQATVGQPLSYLAAASDPDGDAISYYLTVAPDGMIIDRTTGELTWTPTAAQVGSQSATLEVLDGHGGEATQTLTIQVVATHPNRSPRITSTSATQAIVGQVYRDQASASDPDSDPLRFDLVVKPEGMAVNPATGAIVWTPAVAQVGPQDVILRVTDGRGGVDLQQFRVVVAPTGTTPVITTGPTISPAVVGLPYRYQVHAQSAAGTPLTFHLDTGPAGMSLDTVSGVLSWTATADQLGDNPVTVSASNDLGETAKLSFTLNVVADAPDHPPVITSTPRHSLPLSESYLYAVQADDPDNDLLQFRLVTAPPGMTIDPSGFIHWRPTPDRVGNNQVVIRVDDGRGGSDEQRFILQVLPGSSGSVAANQAPSITSTPMLAAAVGQTYGYDAKATDPDGDPMVWTLDRAPAGLSIDPELGTLRWMPFAAQVGPQDVVLRVLDARGGSATQSFTITVRGANLPPEFSSDPPTRAAVSQAYSYAVRAADPEGGNLTYSLTNPPAGMTIDATGTVRWTPAAAQAGSQAVTIRVQDDQGATATQSYTVVVSTTAVDLPPTITSSPEFVGTVGVLYTYAVTAIDPEGGKLSFGLGTVPVGMSIDPTGQVSWTPTPDEVGTQHVTVTVTDPAHNVATEDFTVDVRAANHPPAITSSPVTATTAGLLYEYDVQAADPDNDPLSYRLDAAPAGMEVDALGRITWVPGADAAGTHDVVVVATDDRGASATQPYDLTVSADTLAPEVSLVIATEPATLGEPDALMVSATDDVGVTAVTLTVDGVSVPLDSAGGATVRPDKAGQVTLVATASDAAGNIGRATEVVTVIDPRDQEAPDVAITAPADGAVITAPVDVVGTAADATLQSYTLEVAPASGGPFREFARGTTAVTNGVLGKFDPSGLSNDSYILRLTATDAGGHIATIDETVSVAGALKLGNFQLSFTDLSIPVAGIPLTVTRTYDTLMSGQSSNFGYGWRLEFRDVNIQANVPRNPLQDQGFYSPFRDGTRVYLTLPGGRREGFTFQPTLSRLTQLLIALGAPLEQDAWEYDPAFAPDPGVTDTLTLTGATTMIRDLDTGEYFSIGGTKLGFNPADPSLEIAYQLTTKDGTTYAIDASNGKLQSVADTNHNTLTFTDAGISSSTGQHVVFQRDPQGRMTSVSDPAGNRVLYQYDANGDLVAVTDRDHNVTRFGYSSTQPHYLEQVIDPLGRTGARTEYDAQGRLMKVVDAAGNPVQMSYDSTRSTETVQDALGNPTTYEYDDRGNIVTVVDALGGKTVSTYDANNNLLSETDPLGRTTSYTYDGDGNKLTQTDPLGNVTRFTYDPSNHLLSETDPLGNTTRNTYDARGNLLSTTDAAGYTTTCAYGDPLNPGQPTSITDPAGSVTRFEYSASPRGQLLSEVDALGHETRYTYDSDGRQLTETRTLTTPSGPRTLETTNTYDRNGNLTSVADAEGYLTRYEYDAMGHRDATVDALGRRTEYVFDDRGQLVETRFPDGTQTTTIYDAAGHRVASTDQAGRTTRYVYDPLGRLVETIEPDDTPADLSDNPRTMTD